MGDAGELPLNAAEILAALTTDTTKWQGADIATALTQKSLTSVRFYGRALASSLDVDTAPKNINLDSIVLPNITGCTILAAYAGFITQGWSDVTDQASALTAGTLQSSDDNTNWISAVENIHYYGTLNQASNGIDITPGFECRGNIDIISDVAFNATLYLRLLQVAAATNDSRMWGVRSFVDLLVQ